MSIGDRGEDQPIANVEAEAALLGALMQQASLIDRVADRLPASAFFEPIHARIYQSVTSLHAAGKAANPVTLRPYFEADEEMKELGGPAYLAQLTGSGAAVIGAFDFVEQIAELARRRRLVAGFEEGIVLARDYTASLEDVLADADAVLSSLGDETEGVSEVTAGEAADRLIAEFDQPISGVTCGLIGDADRLLGRARPKKLIIVGGRPGMGKTAFAVTYSLGAARRGHGVLFISLEMGAEELAGRILAEMCHKIDDPIPYEVIRDHCPTRDQMRRIVEAKERLKALPLQIVDRSSLTPGQLDVLIRRYKRRFAAKGVKLELVVVDYLQLMSVDRGTRAGSNYEAVTEISKRAKAGAKANDVAVMALAQLSRKVEEREDKRPRLADLKESGQIEQDADLVLFLYRAAYYHEQAEPDPTDPNHAEWASAYSQIKDRVDLILAKRRDGAKGTAAAYFFADYQTMRGSDFYRLEAAR